jgi:hypothetical protein
MKTLVCITMICVLAYAAGAAVVFTRPPAATGALAASSWLDPDGNDADMYAYDSFIIPTDATITEIQWTGGYLQGGVMPDGTPNPLSDFSVTLYASIAGGSQPNLTRPDTPETTFLAKYVVGSTAGQTYAGTVGTTKMYNYTFVLPAPFHALAGVKYWLRIEGYQKLYPDWGIAAGTVGTNGDGKHYQFSTGMAQFQFVPNDTAFTLLGTLPACGDWGYLVGDIDHNCRVNFSDFLVLAEQWMVSPCIDPLWCGGGDLDKDGSVGLADLVLMAGQWLQCTDPLGAGCLKVQ